METTILEEYIQWVLESYPLSQDQIEAIYEVQGAFTPTDESEPLTQYDLDDYKSEIMEIVDPLFNLDLEF